MATIMLSRYHHQGTHQGTQQAPASPMQRQHQHQQPGPNSKPVSKAPPTQSPPRRCVGAPRQASAITPVASTMIIVSGIRLTLRLTKHSKLLVGRRRSLLRQHRQRCLQNILLRYRRSNSLRPASRSSSNNIIRSHQDGYDASLRRRLRCISSSGGRLSR